MAAAVTLAAKSALMDKVVFDEQSAARIAAAVKWVEQYSLDESTDQNLEDDSSADSAARTVIRGTFSGEWAKNTAKDVSFTADNGDSGTKADVYNYFADVGESGATSACCIIQAGSEWILIAAECG